MDGIKALLSSSRFQGIVIIGILQTLVLFNVINSSQGDGLVVIIQGIIAAAIVVRSVDRNLGDATLLSAGVVTGAVPAAAVIPSPPVISDQPGQVNIPETGTFNAGGTPGGSVGPGTSGSTKSNN